MSLPKDREIELRGCSPVKKIIVPDQKLEELTAYLSTLPMSTKQYRIHSMKLKDALIDSKYFIDGYFKIHNIPYIRFYKIPFTKVQSFTTKVIHPYKLPIKLLSNGETNGYVEEDFTTNGKIFFKSLGIGEIICEKTSASYVHEITHTQIDSVPRSFDDYYNQEVFSIFLEFFHSSLLSTDENLLRLEEANRIYELRELTKELIAHNNGEKELTREDQIENSKYIQSNLIAFHLFSKFYFARNEIKQEMLKDIQRIFDGNLTVEEYLNKYEVSFCNSQSQEKITDYLYRKK